MFPHRTCLVSYFDSQCHFLGVMFYHLMFRRLWHVTLLLFSRCFTISFVCCFIWCFAIFAMISYYLETDVSPLHVSVILLWSSISLLGVMFCHPFYWCFAIFAMTLLSFNRCFAITHLFEVDVSPSHMFDYPTLILNIIVRCDVLSSIFIDVSPSLPWYLVIF